MAYEKVVATYNRLEKAKDAIRALQGSGFSSSDISLLSRDSFTPAEVREPGLWRRLFGGDLRDQEGAFYGHTIEGGGGVLSLRVPETQVARVIEILNGHNPVAVQEKGMDQGLNAGRDAVKPNPTLAAATVSGMTTPEKDEQVFRLAEEQIDVGKRQVQKGTARVRRFVTERPVEARVTLHEEHAELMRRAVSDPNLTKDIDWTDKTFEITETEEQPVVSKTARVVEEVIIRREGSDHVQTVRDTVRRQQVDIERLPKEKELPSR
jgi:uncharacterized protein (TIGR02271 family)